MFPKITFSTHLPRAGKLVEVKRVSGQYKWTKVCYCTTNFIFQNNLYMFKFGFTLFGTMQGLGHFLLYLNIMSFAFNSLEVCNLHQYKVNIV